MTTEKKIALRPVTLVIIGILLVLLLIFVFYSINYIMREWPEKFPEILLTFTVVAGVVVLLASLTTVTIITSYLDLSDPKEALGLPKGSVRALIALSLIVIFSIMSLYLYAQLAGTPSEEQTRFAQQLLTTISTLVVAVAAFYFGTKSVAEAAADHSCPGAPYSPAE